METGKNNDVFASRARVWGEDPVGGRWRPQASAPIYTQRIFQKGGSEVARTKKMATVAKKGSRLDQLKNLAQILANQIDECAADPANGMKLMPQLSRQYRETIREIEEIEGVDKNDDEIGEILSARKADGKSDTVR